MLIVIFDLIRSSLSARLVRKPPFYVMEEQEGTGLHDKERKFHTEMLVEWRELIHKKSLQEINIFLLAARRHV